MPGSFRWKPVMRRQKELFQVKKLIFPVYVFGDHIPCPRSRSTGDAQTKRIIYYDREAERFGVFDETGAELGKYRGEEDRVEIGDEFFAPKVLQEDLRYVPSPHSTPPSSSVFPG